jgi:hypothetical protein
METVMIQYVIVNEREKIEFEKRYQLPYGYANAVISSSLKGAINFLNTVFVQDKQDYIIEKVDCGVVEIVYPEDRKLYYVEVDLANA